MGSPRDDHCSGYIIDVVPPLSRHVMKIIIIIIILECEPPYLFSLLLVNESVAFPMFGTPLERLERRGSALGALGFFPTAVKSITTASRLDAIILRI